MSGVPTATWTRNQLNLGQHRPTTAIGRATLTLPAPSFGYHEKYDVVLVYPNPNPGSKSKEATRRRTIASRMRFIGLDVAREISRDGDEVLLKIAANDELLEEIAEQITMEKRLKAGGYTDYTREAKKLFAPASSSSFFSSLERQRLILAALELGLSEGGCDIDLNLEIERGVLKAVVPVHDASIGSGALMEQWCLAPLSWWPNQPLDEIKEYFGERIALYFAFLQCLTRSLLVPGLAGLFVAFVGLFYGSPDNPVTPFYSVLIMLWLPWFAKAWRREEAQLAYRWNVEDFEATERVRPQFRGELARGFYSPEGHFINVDEHDKLSAAAPLLKRFTVEQLRQRMLVSYVVIMPLVILVIIGVMTILAYRSFLQMSFANAHAILLGITEIDDVPESIAVTFGSCLGSGLYSVWLAVTNYFYGLVAVKLNNWENHRTETAYEDALILKTFCFQFVNSYVTLFYIAFLKASQIGLLPGMTEYCHDASHFDYSAEVIKGTHGGLNPFCMGELSYMLSSLVIFSHMIAKSTEYVMPRMMALMRGFTEVYAMRKRGVFVKPMSVHEEQAMLEPHEGCFAEYLFLMTQLGFVTLFAPAVPIAALVCYVSFLLEIRTDAYKLLHNTQRPRYAGAQDIGSWQKVLVILGVMSIFTNMGLIGVTTTTFSAALPINFLGLQITHDNKVLFLFIFEHIMLGAQYFIYAWVPDLTREMEIARATILWRKRATLEVWKAAQNPDIVEQTKPLVVEGVDAQPRPPRVEWDDDAIPERFIHDAKGLYVEPCRPAEWSRMLKAGEWLAEEKAVEKAKEENLRLYRAEAAALENALAPKQAAPAMAPALLGPTSPSHALVSAYPHDPEQAALLPPASASSPSPKKYLTNRYLRREQTDQTLAERVPGELDA